MKTNEDVKNYLLASSELAQHMQEDITIDRLNKASFRCKLDPFFKNIIQQQIPLELVFKDVPTFDAQNLLIGILIKEIEIGERDLAKKLVKKRQNQ